MICSLCSWTITLTLWSLTIMGLMHYTMPLSEGIQGKNCEIITKHRPSTTCTQCVRKLAAKTRTYCYAKSLIAFINHVSQVVTKVSNWSTNPFENPCRLSFLDLMVQRRYLIVALSTPLLYESYSTKGWFGWFWAEVKWSSDSHQSFSSPSSFVPTFP